MSKQTANANAMNWEVDGKVLGSLEEVSKQIGESLKLADVMEGGKFADRVKQIPAPTKQAKAEDESVETTDVPPTVDPESNTEDLKQQWLDSLPEFKSLDELKEVIKDIDTDTLEAMATDLGCEWKAHENAPITRMRIAMSLHRFFFPELFQPKDEKAKKKTKYGDLTTKDLAKMARENKVSYKKTGHDSIDRMRLIVALKGAGLLPE